MKNNNNYTTRIKIILLIFTILSLLFSQSITAQYSGGNGIGYHSLSSDNSVSLQKPLSVNITVMLEGTYDSLGIMNTALNDSLPISSPYSEDTISIASIPSTSIVDWVLVELRDKSDSTIIILSRSGFLMNDGSVYGTDGISPLTFPVWEDNYYITIRQRNHLSIMSTSTVKFSVD